MYLVSNILPLIVVVKLLITVASFGKKNLYSVAYLQKMLVDLQKSTIIYQAMVLAKNTKYVQQVREKDNYLHLCSKIIGKK